MRKQNLLFSRFEKILLFILGGFFVWALFGLSSHFYDDNSVSVPASGGVYREGVVGDVASLVLNPVFVYGKRDRSPEADISALVFSGLMKFDSQQGKLTDLLATHTLSPDKKTYTFQLKEGLRWHDGASVTIDDVLFTFQDVIKNESFSNEALKIAFQEVKIEKLNDSTITFTIPYPYKYFLTNFTVGLLPKHIWEGIPVEEMEYHEYSSNPVGNGPFEYNGAEEIRRNIFQVRLDSFQDSTAFSPYLEAVEFVFYNSKDALSLDSHSLSGIRPFANVFSSNYDLEERLTHFTNSKAEYKARSSFPLPQYSALFFNLKKNVFDGDNGKKIRLALQLATNKDDIKDFTQSVRIDTPLLETNTEDWLYEFDLEKANGALKDAGFFLPSSKPKTFVPDNSNEQWITYPSLENVWEGKRAEFPDEGFILKGKYPLKVGKIKIYIDGIEKISEEKPELARSWEFSIPFSGDFQDETHEVRVEFIGFSEELVNEDALSFYLEPKEIDDGEEKQKFEIREDKDGNKLKLTLVTSENPYYYGEVAYYLREDFGKIGVDLEIKALNMQDFLSSVRSREYDILLYGQNLGYNLDIYEFFHESQAGKDNLSDYQSLEASILIEEIRSSHVQEVRDRKLQELREIFKEDIPAIFLFSPLYTYPFDSDIEGLNIRFIGFQKDRFSHIDTAYILKEKSFTEDASWVQFPQWFFNNFISFITFSL